MDKAELKVLKSNSPVSKIFDFSDRLSPMLVKEIRQGVRSVSFTSVFIVAQVMLAISILLTIAVGDAESANQLSMVIFTTYVIVVCLLQPLRGLNAVNGEIKNDTIDLISITQLNSWRIVFEKWVSLMAQSLLFAVSILPYLILRYFLGQMELFSELGIFVIVFFIGGAVTGMVVGFSAVPNGFARFICIAGVTVFSIIFLIGFTYVLFGSEQYITDVFTELYEEPSAFTIVLVLMFALVYSAWLFMDFAASKIAPRSENRSLLRRLLCLVVLVFGVVISFVVRGIYGTPTTPYSEATGLMYFILFLSLNLFGLHIPVTTNEDTYLAVNIVGDLKKNSILSFIRYLFYPGWATGYLFVVLGILLLLVQMLNLAELHQKLNSFSTSTHQDQEARNLVVVFFSTLNQWLLPAMFILLFKLKSEKKLTLYIFTILITNVLSWIVMMIDQGNHSISKLFTWLPSVCFYELAEYSQLHGKSYYASDWLIFSSIGGTLISLVVIFVRSIPVFKHIKTQEARYQTRVGTKANCAEKLS